MSIDRFSKTNLSLHAFDELKYLWNFTLVEESNSTFANSMGGGTIDHYGKRRGHATYRACAPFHALFSTRGRTTIAVAI